MENLLFLSAVGGAASGVFGNDLMLLLGDLMGDPAADLLSASRVLLGVLEEIPLDFGA